MAQMYFSKFNINSRIYKVYENPKLQEEILGKVYNCINNELDYCVTFKNDDGIDMENRYKFCDIVKDLDNRTIVGRLVKIFDGESQSYDPVGDTVKIKWEEDKAASCTFCFDLKSEEIAYITRIGFGYRQFTRVFKALVEQCFTEDAFEICLETNIGELTRKITRLKRVLSIESIIIPPNANESECDVLFGASSDEVKQSGATKYYQGLELSSKGNNSINLHTKLIDRMFYGVAKGYGKLIAKGRDLQNNNITITSDEDAPYAIGISEKEKDSLIAFREHAMKGIVQLLIDKSKHTIGSIGELKIEEARIEERLQIEEREN